MDYITLFKPRSKIENDGEKGLEGGMEKREKREKIQIRRLIYDRRYMIYHGAEVVESIGLVACSAEWAEFPWRSYS